MSRFAPRLLRTLNATRLGNESALSQQTDRIAFAGLRSLSQRLDPDQQGRDIIPTGQNPAHPSRRD